MKDNYHFNGANLEEETASATETGLGHVKMTATVAQWLTHHVQQEVFRVLHDALNERRTPWKILCGTMMRRGDSAVGSRSRRGSTRPLLSVPLPLPRSHSSRWCSRGPNSRSQSQRPR